MSNPVLVVFLRAVLLEECVGTKPDTPLAATVQRTPPCILY
jgi:hypothetical protein